MYTVRTQILCSSKKIHNSRLERDRALSFGNGREKTICSNLFLTNFIEFATTARMEARRQRILDLLHAQVPSDKIAEIVGCHKNTVFNVKKMEKDRGDIKRKKGSGGHNRKRTEEFLTGVAAEIEASPTTSMRKLAKELNVSEGLIRKAVKDLGAFSYVRRRRQLLTENSKRLRVERGKKLITWLKHNGSTVRVFSDKKNWTVDQSRNARNDRYLAYHVEDVPSINATKHPASAMMLGVVASDGKRMPPYWFPKGLRVGTEEYLDVMIRVVKPWLDENFGEDGIEYVWQQDSAPGHKSRKTQKWCKENLKSFWPAALWPPSSPDCSPLDYAVWGIVERKACSTPHKSVDAMKTAVEREWANMSVDLVKSVCKSFRPRLEAMVAAGGGHFEK